MKEKELIARLAELFSDRIGDDAAVVGDQVMTVDMLLEDIDFTRSIPLPFIARKSLAVNLSDLAAMGATPMYALVAVAIPQWARAGIDEFFVALRDLAARYAVEVIGGDLSRGDKLVVSVTAVGRIHLRPLLRQGARPGERLYVSRPIGGAAAGLSLLQKGWSASGEPPHAVGYAVREFATSAIKRQIDPEAEVDLGRALTQIDEVTSCIDVSDGLSTDIHNLCDASRCGAEIERERIPIFPDLLTHAPALGISAQDAVLNGGEDYALLFTSSLRESDLSARLGRPVYAIGRMTVEQGVTIKEDGRPRPLHPGGWDHFSGAS